MRAIDTRGRVLALRRALRAGRPRAAEAGRAIQGRRVGVGIPRGKLRRRRLGWAGSKRRYPHKTKPLVDDLTDILDWDKVISRLELTEPDFHPGTANGYHAMTFGWLVGELVHRVSGMSFTDFVQKRIVEPLDLDGMLIGNADAELRACRVRSKLRSTSRRSVNEKAGIARPIER